MELFKITTILINNIKKKKEIEFLAKTQFIYFWCTQFKMNYF